MKNLSKCIMVLSLMLLSGKLFAFWDLEYQDIYYKILDSDAKTLEVVSPKLREGTINIPSTVMHGNVEYHVTTIGTRAFADCENLMAVTIGEGVESIQHSAFRNCANLVSVKLPKSLREIGYDAFMDCRNLKNITLGPSVQKIGIQSFYRCETLERATIESTPQAIELRAFGSCKSLSMIVMKSEVPPSISPDAFAEIDTSAEVFVPKKSLSKYRKDRYWSKFTNLRAVK